MIEDQKKQEILRLRAEKLAKPLKTESTPGNIIEVIVFELGGEHYALEAKYIREVYPLKDYTSLPGAPSFVYGLINVRRKILPLINMKKFFGLPESQESSRSKVIILEEGDLEFGILADSIAGVRKIAPDEIQISLPSLTGVRLEFLKGVTQDRLVILDGSKLLSDEKIIVHETVEI